MSYPNTHTHAHTSQIHKTEKDSLTSAGNPSGLRERPRPPPSACPHPGKTQRSSLNLAGQQGRDGKITDSLYTLVLAYTVSHQKLIKHSSAAQNRQLQNGSLLYCNLTAPHSLDNLCRVGWCPPQASLYFVFCTPQRFSEVIHPRH